MSIPDDGITVILFHIGFHIYMMGLLTLYIRDLELIIFTSQLVFVFEVSLHSVARWKLYKFWLYRTFAKLK
jgi:predicted Kef-type K+ transport protein